MTPTASGGLARVRRAAATFVGVVFLSGVACARGADEGTRPATADSVAVAVAPDSATAATASQVLVAFLEASREGSAHRDALDTLTACDGDHENDAATSWFPVTMLASWTLLPFESRGDTVVARAAVVTVAEQDIDRRGGGFVARQRVRTDPLEWDVYRTTDGRWVVCNGLRFGYVGADSLTVWRPDGASYRTARQLADSIGATR